MHYFVCVEKILAVKVNSKKFEWSYGVVSPESTKAEYEKCLIKINIRITDDKDVFESLDSNKKFGKFNNFFAVPGENTIHYGRNFLPGKKLRYSISIHKNTIDVTVGKTYLKYIKYRIINIHSLSNILTDLTSGMLLENGYATLHCSSVKLGDKTIVIFAPSNTGKTLTAMSLCKEKGASFIGEDLALTDGQKLYAVPWTSTFWHYDNLEDSICSKMLTKSYDILPFLELIKLSKRKTISDYLGTNRVLYESDADMICILERGKHSINSKAADSYRKILTLNRYAFNYFKAPIGVAFSYFNPEYSQDNMLLKEKEIIKNLVDRCSVFILKEENAANYYKTISDIIYRSTERL